MLDCVSVPRTYYNQNPRNEKCLGPRVNILENKLCGQLQRAIERNLAHKLAVQGWNICTYMTSFSSTSACPSHHAPQHVRRFSLVRERTGTRRESQGEAKVQGTRIETHGKNQLICFKYFVWTGHAAIRLFAR